MRIPTMSMLGITVAAMGLCAWSGIAIAQTGASAPADQICLMSSSANLGVPSLTAAERADMAVRPVTGTGAQRQKAERVVFSEMMFASDSDRLSDVGVGRCYLVAQKLRRGTNVSVVIQGHSQISGSSALNHELSLRRAEAVRQQIANFGIAESRMSTVRFGKAAASFKAGWVRAVHERAEFEIEAKDRGASSNNNPEPVDRTTL